MGLGDKIVGDGAERGIIGGTVPIVGKEDNLECLRQDNTIQPEGPVANVPRFKLNTIFEGNVIPPVHLPEPSQTGPGRKNGGKVETNASALLRDVRTRAHQTHFTL